MYSHNRYPRFCLRFATAPAAALGIPVLVAATLLSIPITAQAAWVIEPSARLETAYDDNVRLRPVNEEDGIVTTVNAQARLRNVTEVSSISALAGIGVTHYSGVDSFDDDTRDRMFLQLASRRLTERGSFGLDGSLRREDLLRTIDLIDSSFGSDLSQESADGATSGTEGLSDELVTDGDADLGTVQTLVRRSTIRVVPNASYDIDPRTSIRLSYRYVDTSFDDTDDADSIQDSQSHAGILDLRRELSPRDSGSLQIQRTRFKPDLRADVDTWEARFGWERQVTERVRSRLSAGASRIESDGGNETGFLFSARIDRSTERGNLYALVERTLRPSAFGEIIEFDQLIFGTDQAISDRLSWSLRARASRNDSSAEGVFDRSQNYADVSPSLRWQLTDAWSIGTGYTYTWVDRDRDTTSTTRNAVSVSLTYSPPRRL
jgi:hypothetical protein